MLSLKQITPKLKFVIFSFISINDYIICCYNFMRQIRVIFAWATKTTFRLPIEPFFSDHVSLLPVESFSSTSYWFFPFCDPDSVVFVCLACELKRRLCSHLLPLTKSRKFYSRHTAFLFTNHGCFLVSTSTVLSAANQPRFKQGSLWSEFTPSMWLPLPGDEHFQLALNSTKEITMSYAYLLRGSV